jgi:hypothetical protein
MKTMGAIRTREQLLASIAKLSEELKIGPIPQEQLVTQISSELLQLRHSSIKVVELIVLWRDQLRYLTLMGTKSKQLRKRRA